MKEMKKIIPDVVEKLPVEEMYTDLLQPSFQALGKAGENIFKFVALPIRFLGMTADELEKKYKDFIARALSGVEEEKRQKPSATIAGLLLEHVKYVFDDEQEKVVEEMFAELLSSACNQEKCDSVHPSYVHVLQQITWLEALILKKLYEYVNEIDCIGVVFKGIEHPQTKRVVVISEEAETLYHCDEEEESVFFHHYAAMVDEMFGATWMQFMVALNSLQQLNLVNRISLNRYKDSDEYSLDKHNREHIDDFDPKGRINVYGLTSYAVNLLSVCLK